MEIKRDESAEPASNQTEEAEVFGENASAEGSVERTVGDFLDSLPPLRTYKRFAPRRRRVFRLRLPFTFDYEYD